MALCNNPNILEVYRPAEAEALALVSCFGDGQLAVVGLGTFTVLATIDVGAGADEIAVDAARAQAYVANTRAGTIAVVGLDHRDRRYLTAWARLGLAD